ncbi:uncharacterized protein LOC111341978 [Stylophora pistillata]|uniref:uncharacterized protein LOC111341978 n=1 Tax=Stylophora pistillata TaxID=50429 RepID=UPI000C04CEFB|nr:uncharacterized protein LOC111341978 [Stylophora pistillata]
MLKFHLLSCRVRAKAKVCVAMAWQVSCAPSDVVKGIFDKVIGGFNPFCTGDRDPWSTKIDSCAPYRIPYREPVCQDCKCNRSGDGRGNQKALDDDEELSGGLIGFIVCIAVIVCIIGLITCYLKFRRCIEDLPDRAEVP